MNYYQTLGIHETVTRREIRAAYLQLVQEVHPDRHVDDPRFSERDERFKTIQEAYEVLYDVRRRDDYDRHRLIPRARSSEMPVVTPVSHGRHDLPYEWFNRAKPRHSKKNVRLHQGLILAVVIVLMCVGFRATRRTELETHATRRHVAVGTRYYVNQSAKNHLNLEIDQSPDKPVGQSKSQLELVTQLPTSKDAAERSSKTSQFQLSERVHGHSVRKREIPDEIRSDPNTLPVFPDSLAAPFDSLFDAHSRHRIGAPADFSATDFFATDFSATDFSATDFSLGDILMSIQKKDPDPLLDEPLRWHRSIEAIPNDYARGMEPGQFDLPSGPVGNRRRGKRSSASREAWRSSNNSHVSVEARYEWVHPSVLAPLDPHARGTEPLRYESMLPDLGRTPHMRNGFQPLPGFPLASSVPHFISRRESTLNSRSHETPRGFRYQSWPPEIQTTIGEPAIKNVDEDCFFRPSSQLPTPW